MTKDYFDNLMNPQFLSVHSKENQIENLKIENAALQAKVNLLEKLHAELQQKLVDIQKQIIYDSTHELHKTSK